MVMILGGSGTITGDKIIADANGNVGIGTNTPTYKLDIKDNTTGQQLRLSSSHINGTSMAFDSSSANGRVWRIGSNYVDGYGEFAIYDATASLRRLNIDSAGRVTMPYQPMVYANKTTGGWASYYNGGSYATFVFDTASINVGNSYNGSTGIFTCPTSGYYKVTASILMGNASGTSGHYCYKNSSVVGQSSYAYFGGNNGQTTFSWLVNCSTNDTLKIVAWSSAAGGSYASIYEAYYNFLQIELVG